MFEHTSHKSVAGTVFHQKFALHASQVTQFAFTVAQLAIAPHPPPTHDLPSPEGDPDEQAVQSPSLLVES